MYGFYLKNARKISKNRNDSMCSLRKPALSRTQKSR